MAGTAGKDQATFEDILSEAFGKDMTRWRRVSTLFYRDADAAVLVTRLVLAADAVGYTLGSVMMPTNDA